MIVPVIHPLSEAIDPLLYGGKAAGLAKLLRPRNAEHICGFRVPDGLAIDYLVVKLAVEKESRMQGLVEQIGEQLTGPLVVRSSAVGEDGADASFAGQHLTKLNVGIGELGAAISEVAASAHSPSALAYRQRHNITGAPQMGVIIQPLVRARVAGVMFTNTLDGRTVIEAARGLGEAVVQGIVTPDNYIMDAARVCLQKRLGDQRIMVREAEDASGTVEVPVAPHTDLLLDARWREHLYDVGVTCQKIFGASKLDIEWAIESDTLYVLQVRPITA